MPSVRPAPLLPPLHLRFRSPWTSPAEPQLPAEMARLGSEHQAVSQSPRVAEWSRRLDPRVPIHSLAFTTFPLYKDWLIPFFPPVAFAMKSSPRAA